MARHILSGFKAIGGHSPIYHLNPAISRAKWYTSISHPLIPVNIIITQSKSPLEALFHSGTPITMNAITSRGIFTTYAELTPQKISLLQSHLPATKLYCAVKTRPPLPNDEVQTIVANFGISVPVTALPQELLVLLVRKYKARVGVTFICQFVEIHDKTFLFLSLFQQICIFTPYFAYNF